MRSTAECEVVARVPIDLEKVGIRIVSFVPVSGAVHQLHTGVGRNHSAVDFHVLTCRTEKSLHWRIPTEYFLNCSRDLLRVLLEYRTLLRVQHEGVNRVTNQVRGCFIPANEKEIALTYDFGTAESFTARCGLAEQADEVISGRIHSQLDKLLEVFGKFQRGVDSPYLQCGIDTPADQVDGLIAPLLEFLAVLSGDAQHVQDHHHRQRGCHISCEVRIPMTVVCNELIDEFIA